MAITYTRLSENLSEESLTQITRAPASVEFAPLEECLDLPKKFNLHYISKKCF
jgi:hypothetical protein